MKKLLLVSLFFTGYLPLVNAQQPERIYSFAKVDKPHEYYIQQAELWWKVLEKDKTSEDAWYYYYRTNRNCKGTYKDIYGFDGHRNDGWTTESPYLKELDEIVKLIEKHIPNTFTYYRLKEIGSPSSVEGFDDLQKAYAINPNNAEIYDSFVAYYEMTGNAAKRKEFNEKLFYANEISSGFLNYGYNVLMSLKPNAIILTYGDNDTFPLWLLQDALNIRTDAVVLNIPLLADASYRKIIFEELGFPSYEKEYKDGATSESEKELVEFIIRNKPEKYPLYIGLPAWKQMKDFEKNLYLEGLVLEYSDASPDNIAILKNNFEHKYRLDYLMNRFEFDISASMVDRISVNYLPGIFKLYDHYNLSGDLTRALKMKEMGLSIARKAGKDWSDKAAEQLK